MNTLTKLVLGAMGRVRPVPAMGDAPARIALPPPRRTGGMPLMEVLDRRGSSREFRPDPIEFPMLADLLWAANGVNRSGAGRTAPSALKAHEIDVYVAMAQGTYRYDPDGNELLLAAGADTRRITGYQDFVDHAPLDLVYVADHGRMAMVAAYLRDAYAHVAAGAIAQDVGLYCAANGLANVLRAWIDREAIAQALGLPQNASVLLSQTVGWPAH